jgi:hypothetical protein
MRARIRAPSAHLFRPVDPRQQSPNESDAVTDEMLLERLTALGRLIDPAPWIVSKRAEAVFTVSHGGLAALPQEPGIEPPAR